MLGKVYTSKVSTLIETAIDSQYEHMQNAAELIYESMKKGGLLHLFGCGHSHILVEEGFYRAGGLVPINPIFESSLMLHEGAVKSSKLEQMSGYASLILDRYRVKAGEVIIIFSNSGINSLPIEMAQAAIEKGLTVIVMTSMNYAKEESRHITGEKLYQLAEVVIDTGVPCGDAIMELKHSGVKAVPASTAVGCVLFNALISEVLDRYDKNGIEPPVFISGNVKGGFEKNVSYIEEYRKIVKCL